MTEHEQPVPTGSLPERGRIRALVDEAHEKFCSIMDGAVNYLYPPLAAADPAMFGLCFVGLDGDSSSAGASTAPFVLMSAAKPFTFALACDVVGTDVARERIGANATGLAFNSLEAVERNAGRTNPLVNSGAIATVELLGGDPWPLIRDGLSRFAGRELSVDDAVLRSVSATNTRNRALTHSLDSLGMLHGDPVDLLDAYTKQCCLLATSEDLAVMGATLATHGINPLTGERVVSAASCRAAMAVMTTAGLYETSGDWLYRVGLPGKSGISGGIVAVSPGKGALGAYSPLVDSAGNSVRGQMAAEFLSERLGLGLFAI